MKKTKKPSLSVKDSAIQWFNSYLTLSAERGVISEKVLITPERAAVLLSRNPDNRNIREAKIAQLVNDLKSGKFRFNGETIIVAKDGMLNDGQHRLFASVKAGVPFETILVVGTERESRFTIDTGAAKSASDHLSFQGISNTSTAAAMARYILSHEREGNFTKRAGVSTQDQIERVKEDELLREIAAWCDARRNRMRNMVKSSLAGFLYYLAATKAPNEAKLFMDQLATGVGLDAKSPVYLLREKLLHGDKLSEVMKIEAFARAWNHWCKSPTTEISRLQIMGDVPVLVKPVWSISDGSTKHRLPAPTENDLVLIPSSKKKKSKAAA